MKKPPASDPLQQGLAFHRQGDLAKARSCYETAIKSNSRNSDALHLLGLVTASLGDIDRGISWVEKALRVQPVFPAAWFNLGNFLQKKDRLTDAVKAYRKALSQQPKSADFMLNLGSTLMRLEQYQEAAELYTKALSIDPQRAEINHSLGLAHSKLGNLPAAQEALQRAVVINPQFLPALEDLGGVLQSMNRVDEAVTIYLQALELNPRNAVTWCSIGICLTTLGKEPEAHTAFAQALAIDPQHIPSLCNLGNLYKKQNRMDEAMRYYELACRADPNAAEPRSNAGCIYLALGNLPAAETCFRQVLARHPDYAAASWNLAVTLLTAGDFTQGWPAYESRWTNEQLAKVRRTFPQPLWLGVESIEGKTLLIHSEQGIGDTLQFIRYLPLLAARGAKVHLQVQPSLKSLLSSMEGAATVASQDEPPPKFDFHCPLLSLPHAFATNLITIPVSVPYVQIQADRRAAWKARVAHFQGRKVGINWSGNPKHDNDHNRSIPLTLFRRVVDLSPPVFFNLQWDVRATEQELLASMTKVTDLRSDLANLADTAGLIEQMDLVITVDTATAHLAGAMGKPVWVLLPFNADWRWLQNRDDSPWYPTMRLFRQPTLGDWPSVLERVTSALNQS